MTRTSAFEATSDSVVLTGGQIESDRPMGLPSYFAAINGENP
jgi:hypothetical protein